MLSQITRFSTGIEIHLEARIGQRLFIDHVISGHRADRDHRERRYALQGVTLGGTGKDEGKRHPMLRDGVFAGNNANIPGNSSCDTAPPSLRL